MPKKKRPKSIYVKTTGEENLRATLASFSISSRIRCGETEFKNVKNGKIDYYGDKIPVSKLKPEGTIIPHGYHEFQLYSIPRKVLKDIRKKRKKRKESFFF